MQPAINKLIDLLKQYEGKMVSADQVILHAHLLVKEEWQEVQKAYSIFFDSKNKQHAASSTTDPLP